MNSAAGISRTVALACAAAVLLGAVAATPGGDRKPCKDRAPAKPLRPNVIVVMTDDQSDSLQGSPRRPATRATPAPTILSIAGATPRRRLDGRPLRPLARDKRLERKRIVLLETPAGTLGVRTPLYAYFEHPTGEVELYDLRADPLQLHSRHAAPAYAEIRARLARRLEALRGCSGEACRRAALP